NLAAATKEWGIEATVDAIAVHARVEQAGAQSSDYLEEARRLPYVFDIRDYGNAPFTAPLRSLESLLVPIMPVKTSAAAGYTVTPIIPVPGEPNAPKSWGETDVSALEK